MRAWETVVAKMASLSPEQMLATRQLASNNIAPPRNATWPEYLPVSVPLRRFYALCDGGFFGNCAYRIFGINELVRETTRCVENLRDYDERGDVLTWGLHVVFGEDSFGAPLVWNSVTDKVATFFFKGGDWEPVAPSASMFLEKLFNPDPRENPEWAQAVEQVFQV